MSVNRETRSIERERGWTHLREDLGLELPVDSSGPRLLEWGEDLGRYGQRGRSAQIRVRLGEHLEDASERQREKSETEVSRGDGVRVEEGDLPRSVRQCAGHVIAIGNKSLKVFVSVVLRDWKQDLLPVGILQEVVKLVGLAQGRYGCGPSQVHSLAVIRMAIGSNGPCVLVIRRFACCLVDEGT